MRQKTTDHTEEELRLKLLCFKTLRLPQLIFYYYCYFRILVWGEIGRRVDRGFAGQFLSRSAFEWIEVILRTLSVNMMSSWCPVSLSMPMAHLRLTSARAHRRSFSTPIAGIGLTLALLTEVDSGFKTTIDFCQQSECKPNTSNYSSWIWKREFTAEPSSIFHLKGQKKYFPEKKISCLLGN